MFKPVVLLCLLGFSIWVAFFPPITRSAELNIGKSTIEQEFDFDRESILISEGT